MMQKQKRVGRWTLLQDMGSRWLCRCDCGTERTVLTYNLSQEKTKSCGCARFEAHQRAMSASFPEAAYGIR